MSLSERLRGSGTLFAAIKVELGQASAAGSVGSSDGYASGRLMTVVSSHSGQV